MGLAVGIDVFAVLGVQSFGEWLYRQRSEVVGLSCSHDQNLLANWLHDTAGGWWEVGAYTCSERGGYWANLPEWAVDFVRVLDKACGGVRVQVRGEVALQVLACLVW